MASCLALLAAMFVLSACLSDKHDEGADPLRVHVGEALPAFTVVTLSDDTVSRDSLLGHPSVLVFFSTQCGDCQRALPELQRAYEQLKPQGVRFLCIARDEGCDVVAPFWEANHLSMPCSPQPDRRVYNLFATSVVPRVFISDSSAIVRYTLDDRTPFSADFIIQQIRYIY